MTPPSLRNALVFFWSLVWLTATAPAAPAPPRPNIIVVLADDMGFSDIGCYGSEIATPNLDRLAKEGIRYTQFYNAARCCPSRASLLTGLYPHQTGVGHMVDDYAAQARAALGGPAYQTQLNDRCVTLAEALRTGGGYETFMAGKWHVGAAREAWPDRRGFDRSFALIAGATNYFGQGPQNTDEPLMPFELNGERWEPPREGFFTTEAFTDRAVEFVRGRTLDKPFFLYLAYNAPHWPLQELSENIAAYRGKYLAGWDAIRDARLQRQANLLGVSWALSPSDRFVQNWASQTEAQKAEWDERMAIYAAQISHLDRGVGRLLDALRETDAERNTLILFLSDNGGCAEKIDHGQPGAAMGTRDSYTSYRQAWANVSNTPFRRFKTWTHEGGISTPLIARWPDGIPTPGISRQVGSIIDFMPTFLQLAGVDYPKTYAGKEVTPPEGTSLVPTFQNGGTLPARALYWEHEGNRAVLDGETKLLGPFGQPWELYNLEQDRTELHDLAADKRDVVRDLATKYDAWAARCNVRPWELTKK